MSMQMFRTVKGMKNASNETSYSAFPSASNFNNAFYGKKKEQIGLVYPKAFLKTLGPHCHSVEHSSVA